MSKEELLKKIDEAKSIEEIKELRSEIENLDNDVEEKIESTKNSNEITENKISKEEERKLMKESEKKEDIEQRNFVKIEKKEDKEVKEEKRTLKEVLDSKEYRSAWAKRMMGVKLNEKEEKALGDAITTTSTEFVASAENVQGINNGGMFIPNDVRTDMLKIIEETSPFLRDVRKLAVNSNIEMPYLNAADDAEWYAELEDTKNEGQEWKSLKLTSHELAKQVEITWKLEKMSVDAFINFITLELANKMGRALATAVLYGTGENQPTGAFKGLKAVNGEEVIQAMINTYASLPKEMKINAKVYLSNALAIQIVGYKDNNGNYPYLQGLNKTALFPIEVDPFIKDEDLLAGNPQNYVLNTVEAISVNREVKVTPRRTIYSTYAMYDGKPYPNAFAKGAVTKTTPTTSSK